MKTRYRSKLETHNYWHSEPQVEISLNCNANDYQLILESLFTVVDKAIKKYSEFPEEYQNILRDGLIRGLMSGRVYKREYKSDCVIGSYFFSLIAEDLEKWKYSKSLTVNANTMKFRNLFNIGNFPMNTLFDVYLIYFHRDISDIVDDCIEAHGAKKAECSLRDVQPDTNDEHSFNPYYVKLYMIPNDEKSETAMDFIRLHAMGNNNIFIRKATILNWDNRAKYINQTIGEKTKRVKTIQVLLTGDKHKKKSIEEMTIVYKRMNNSRKKIIHQALTLPLF